ncbi:MAG: acetyl-CoA carboxylase biotin carboxyl carrier protein [Fusobacteriota bacterium]
MDVTEIKKLMSILDSTDVTEINLESEGTEISLKKDMTLVKQMNESIMESQNNEDSQESLEEEDENISELVSLNVGEISLKDDLKVGKEIAEDEVVAVIKSVGVKTEVKSDKAGVLKELLVKDGEIVDFGKPLMKIETK